MKYEFEYGYGTMSADLPDSTDVIIPGQTVPDSPCILQDMIVEETLRSISNPISMEPLSQLAFKGAKCVIIFPDRVKGGEQSTSHRKVSIRLILDELFAAGVEKKDILLLFSNGLHRKNTNQEIRGVLGDELFNEYWSSHQIIKHDSEDSDNLVDLGTTEGDDPVIMNKHVYDADVAIRIGHVQGNPYDGYSSGYKHSATGIALHIGAASPATTSPRSCIARISRRCLHQA